jgi:hypothetical protein
MKDGACPKPALSSIATLLPPTKLIESPDVFCWATYVAPAPISSALAAASVGADPSPSSALTGSDNPVI